MPSIMNESLAIAAQIIQKKAFGRAEIEYRDDMVILYHFFLPSGVKIKITIQEDQDESKNDKI